MSYFQPANTDNPNWFPIGQPSADGLWVIKEKILTSGAITRGWVSTTGGGGSAAGITQINDASGTPLSLVGGVSTLPPIPPLVNALNSTAATSSLAAAQGKVLSDADVASFTLTAAGLVLTLKNGTALPPVPLPANVLDGNDKPVLRTNNTANIAPTSLEVPSPIKDDTATVILGNGTLELWVFGTAWTKTTTLTYVTSTAFSALYGTITNSSPTGNTDAVANWGYLPGLAPALPHRLYLADPVTNKNHTSTLAEVKALLAAPDEIVDVSGVTFPITFPATTLPGAPVFAPATPTSTTAVYKIVTGANLAYAAWNGTQYIAAPAALPAPTAAADYFSNAVASANTAGAPNGTNDLTEAIRRDGNLGLFTNPLSTLDVGGSFATKTRVVGVSATADVIQPTDSVILYTGTFAAPQPVTFPPATAFPGRIITILIDAGTPNFSLDLSSVSSFETPNNTFATALTLKGAAVQSVTWQSASNNWRLINWVERKYYAATGYSIPADEPVATFNSMIGTLVGTDYQLPNTISNYLSANANWTGNVSLPATNNSTGRFSIWNTAGFDENVLAANTDLPRSILLATNQSIHFEWSKGLWRWNPAPVLSRQTRFSPNDVVNGAAILGNIPSQAQQFVIADGNFASPLTLPLINQFSELLTISSSAGFNASIATTNQTAGAVSQTLISGGSITFAPSPSGWTTLNATVINGHTRYVRQGTYAAPLTGTINVSNSVDLIFVAASSTVVLPSGSAHIDRRLIVKKPGAGSNTITGSIDGVANRSLTNADESLTLHYDGATWARI